MVTCQSVNQLNTCKGFLSLQNGLSVWFTRLHNHGEDLIWQLSRRQSLTPFTRRINHKHSLSKKLAVHRVLYPSMLTESWVEGKSVEEKDATNWENHSLMRIVMQNQFKNLGELHKEWTEAGVEASRAPHTDVSRNLATVVVRGVLPGLRRRRTGLLRSGPKSSFQMRESFIFHLETKVLLFFIGLIKYSNLLRLWIGGFLLKEPKT